MRQELASMRLRKEKGNRNYNEKTNSGFVERNGDKFPFKMRQTQNSRKNTNVIFDKEKGNGS